MKNATRSGTSTYHSTIGMAKPNISSSSHPRAIFQALMWNLIKHINQNHPGLLEAKPPPPSTSDSTSRLDFTNYHQIGLYPSCLEIQSVFSNPSSKTSNLIHDYYRDPKRFSNQGSRTINSMTQFLPSSKAFVQPRIQD